MPSPAGLPGLPTLQRSWGALAALEPWPHGHARPTRGWQVAEGSVWLLLSPWGAGTCPCATKSLCRKMLLAFPAVCFFLA